MDLLSRSTRTATCTAMAVVLIVFAPPAAADEPGSTHWAFQPIERPDPPSVQNESWPRNPIDRFILARLEEEGVSPSPPADRRTLIRRVSLDLIGLPPTPEQVRAFVNDERPGAYRRLVDRLLASPAYGERWASVWLDLARYADSKGYEADRYREIWPYRDWVIDAYNTDMPFDRFTIEQIAGDLLESPTRSQKIATAFHRNTMTNDEGGTVDEEFRVAAVMDRADTTGQVWMGLTMGCAKCHDHKYDPISQREYYQFYAFFNQTADSDKNDDRPTIPVPTPTQREEIERIETKIAELQEKLPKDASSTKESTKDESPNPIRAKIAELKKARPEPPTVPIMRRLPEDKRRETHILLKGNYQNRGQEVKPGVPEAFHSFPEDAPRTRLGLAKWLVDEDNPLTARVVANRYWARMFGIGLVETEEDFGTQGARPTHPKLLDWLASEFMERGWSRKELCRLIVTSATYRQSSHVSPELYRRDPRNRLLARGPRFRLSAEAIRDQALAISGLLSRKMHGPPVMPPQPDGVWQVVYSGKKWKTSKGEDRYRRGLYTYWRRTSPYPSMSAFDATSRSTCTIRRIRTNTPLQALVTLNDPVYVEAAEALARRIMTETAPDADAAQRAAYGFRLCTARPPTGRELDRIVELYQEELGHYRGKPSAARQMATTHLGPAADELNIAELAAWTVVSNVLLNLDEVLMKG